MTRSTRTSQHRWPGMGRAPSGPRARRRTATRRRRRFESALAGLGTRTGVNRAGQAVQGLWGRVHWHPSKWISLGLAVAVVAAILWLHGPSGWFVYAEDVSFTDLTYLSGEELYQRSGVDGWSIFWLEPGQIRQALLEHPYVADVQVRLGLPHRVEIQVQEAQPVALWVTRDGTYWLLADGTALAARTEVDPGLPQILDALQEARALDSRHGIAVDARILESALSLMDTLPELGNQVRYNRSVGLNFPLPQEQVWVYWGDGYNLQAKRQNLEAARRLLEDGKTSAQIIDVRYVHRPYVR